MNDNNLAGTERPEDPIPTEIDTDQPGNVQYWCRSFGVSLPALQEAVRAVGTEVSAVRAHLQGPEARR